MCKLCEKKSVYQFTNKRKLCKICFIRYFQKKVLYTIRKFGMIKKGDIIVYKKGNNFREIVLKEILNMLSEKAMVQIINLPTKKKFNKIAEASSADITTDKIVHSFIKGNVNDLKEITPIKGKTINPLYLFLDKEILLYAKLKKLKFKEKKIKQDKISKFVDELEKKHPEIKHSIVKSYLELYS